ncbi:DsbA family protein [Candidatus Saccharibacteria bacterium CPR2]|nr:DsbA family protein [Candidatus Saccharibacteria bacterium CPR2]
MGKNFWIILTVCVLLLVGIFVVASKQEDEKKSDNPSYTEFINEPLVVRENDHKRGASQPKVTLIEFADFQCPACGSFYPILKQLESDFPQDLQMVFRHFPLTNIHPNAMSAHRAAEAAAKQGKFFEMHDLLYENQQQWSESSSTQLVFEAFAKQLGLNEEQFKQDLSNEDAFNFISAQSDGGRKLGLSGTPSFYINGERIENDKISSYEDFKRLIEEKTQNQ